jgi:hypothetical protein
MAVVPAQLDFLDACYRHGAFVDPVVTIGSQQYLGPAGVSLASVLGERYGVRDYRDVDRNGDAALLLDLTQPLPDELREVAGTVLEVGTLEHVFNIGRAVSNLHHMLRPDGRLIVISPQAWYGHGFYNLDRRLWHACAAVNAWDPLVEGWFLRMKIGPFKRFVTVLTRDGEERGATRLWTDRLLNRVIPTGLLYLGCYHKTRGAPFVDPSDVFVNF